MSNDETTAAEIHMPSYETGYREGESNCAADFQIALDDTEFEGEVTPAAVAEYIQQIEREHLHMEANWEAFARVCEAEGMNGMAAQARNVLSSLTIRSQETVTPSGK